MSEFAHPDELQLGWTFERRRHEIRTADIYGATFFVAVSLRNPLFSNEWLSGCLADIRRFRGAAIVTLVDGPYKVSVLEVGLSREARLQRLANLRQQGDEQLRRLRRIIAPNTSYCELVSWRDLVDLTPLVLRHELSQAFLRRGRCYALVIDQVLRSTGVATVEEAVAAADFFINEAPVLAHIYYSVFDGAIDVYPGPQADFFWALDAGDLADELPAASELARRGEPHTYATTLLK